MKNLATCKPSEFVAQTAKIRVAVANWLDVIELFKIRNTQPAYRFLPKDATQEQRAAVILENAKIKKEQTTKNLNLILDNMLAKHPQETMEVLALCCFVEPAEIDNYTMDQYLECIMDMFENKTVLRFFSLLAQLEQTPTSTGLKA